MNKKIQKIIFYIILTIILDNFQYVYALKYTDFYHDFFDDYLNSVDDNEGQTIFRSLNIPCGGRAESMGSAFAALANDIGFLEFNPAGSCVLENTEIAFLHNSWIADSALDTIAYSIRHNNLGLGSSIKCFYVPFTEYDITGETVASSYYSETTATLNFSYNFLSGYDFKGLAFGCNLKAAYRSMPDYANDNTGIVTDGSGLSQSAIAIMADIGFLLRFNLFKYYSSRTPNFQLALVFNNFGCGFTSLGSHNKAQLDDALPSKVVFGISYKLINPLTITFELRKPINILNISLSEKMIWALGMNLQCTSFFSFQSGFLLSGANPRISFGAEFAIQNFLMNVNYTFDMTSSINPINRISLSAKMNLGDRGRSSLQEEVDLLYNEALHLYNAEKLEDAIILWQQALNLNPDFDPAKDGIEKAKVMLELLQKIKEYQSLDN